MEISNSIQLLWLYQKIAAINPRTFTFPVKIASTKLIKIRRYVELAIKSATMWTTNPEEMPALITDDSER